MPNRILKESICTSDNLNDLSPQEEIFFYRLIVNCDDYGIADARLKMLRAKCFPLKIDTVKENDIEKWLKALIKANLCFLYEVEGKRYLKMTSWERHQQIRAKRSKFPTPDSNGYQMIAEADICPRNPIQSESESNPNSNVEVLFNCWNEQKIIIHKKITPDIKKALEKALKSNSAEEISNSIIHFRIMLNDEKYEFCSYKWSLVTFLSREKGYRLFMDDGEKWINYYSKTKQYELEPKSKHPLAGTIKYVNEETSPAPGKEAGDVDF